MSNVIKIGNLTIDSFKVGAADCSIYLGTTKLYPQGEPPVTDFKYKLTLSNGDIVSAETDSTSAITQNDILAYTATCVSAEIGNSVTSIGEYTFESCSSLSSVTIPNSVTSIGVGAFVFCSGLTSITIPNSVTSIGASTFYYCSSLSSVTIPNSVTSIGDTAFAGCSGLTSITIPNSVTGIGQSTFYECSSLSSITIPNSVTSIGHSAFDGCSSLTSVDIPSGVTSIGEYTFDRCSSLTSITIPNSVTSIGVSAFDSCSSLTSVDIPSGVTSIDGRTFYRCSSLTSITIPNSVTSISDGAFEGCSGLTSITIPGSVTSIGNRTFYNCRSLSSLTINATTPPTLGNANALTNTNNCPIYVPCESVEAYKAASVWSDYSSRITCILPYTELQWIEMPQTSPYCAVQLVDSYSGTSYLYYDFELLFNTLQDVRIIGFDSYAYMIGYGGSSIYLQLSRSTAQFEVSNQFTSGVKYHFGLGKRNSTSDNTFDNLDASTTYATFNTSLLKTKKPYFGAINQGSSLYVNGESERIYSIKVYDNEVLVGNYIPVKRNSDNYVTLYDTVSEQFCDTVGGGTMVAGPAVN